MCALGVFEEGSNKKSGRKYLLRLNLSLVSAEGFKPPTYGLETVTKGSLGG